MSSVPFSESGLFDGCYAGFGNGHGREYDLSQLGASTSCALLDGNTQQLNAAATEVPKRKEDRAEKAAMALKSHSEAERRRRERINAHLATLRSMVPCADKMDKAALLAEVITHVKKLKANAARISRHCPVPADADNVTVELVPEASSSRGTIVGCNGGGSLVKATLSCGDGADLFADVKHALRPLRLKVVGSEFTTLGGRVRFTFLVSSCGDDDVSLGSVRQALQSVLDKANPELEFAPRASLLNKRRRVSTFESSSSSS
ncbi:transcription factor bHLH30-like [Phragmites australis]|uniref:transcription factor bHLH30-like n=1 Tax=Phragmites australis TaxID=29695 RepID=UPI002D797BB3|nr:transcription factor bHLH30-like [Phragmites australis]